MLFAAQNAPKSKFQLQVNLFELQRSSRPTAAGQRLWNMLPIHLRLCDSLEQFKWLLKTHLFGA